MMSIPVRTRFSWRDDSFPARSVKRVLSRAMIWETLATESFGRSVSFADKKTFPGASAHWRLLVNGTQTIVAIRLLFKGSPWTTATGRRKPGPDPVGSGRSAHHISPWATFTRTKFLDDGGPLLEEKDRAVRSFPRKPCSWLP